MKLKDAINKCHVRSSIYRTGNPTKIFSIEDLQKLPDFLKKINKDKIGKVVPNRYPKNHTESFYERIPIEEQKFEDWEEYDPREDDDCSLFAFND